MALILSPQHAISLGISISLAVATLNMYTIIPELKKLRGLILRSYLVSYIMYLFSLMMICIFGQSEYQSAWLTWIITFLYFGFARVCWTSVMGFETWKTFRRIEPIQDVDMEQDEEKKFRWYSMYAWGGSFAVIYIAVVMVFLVGDGYEAVGISLVLLSVFAIVISNIYFYGSTGLIIWRRSQESAQPAVDDVKKHHEENKRWFYSYLGLNLIMGVTAMICLSLWYFHLKNPNGNIGCLCTVEVLQSILVFITCVWRVEVKRFFLE